MFATTSLECVASQPVTTYLTLTPVAFVNDEMTSGGILYGTSTVIV